MPKLMKFLKIFAEVLVPKFVYPTIKLGITSNKKYSSIFSFILYFSLNMADKRATFTSTHVRIQIDEAGPGELCRGPCGPYAVWFCLGSFCPLPAAFCIGRKMNEQKTLLKYGILGKLIFVTHLLCSITVSHFNFERL